LVDFEGITVVHLELGNKGEQAGPSTGTGALKLGGILGHTTYIVWGIIFSHAGAIKQEPHGLYVLALALAERSHKFVKLGGLLNLKENFVVGISDLVLPVRATYIPIVTVD
jgi:hypothetical protein